MTRRNLLQLRMLADLEHGQRDAIASELAEDAAVSAHARTVAEASDKCVVDLAADWVEIVSRGTFDPDASAAFGHAIAAAVEQAGVTRQQAEMAERRHDATRDRWQVAHARVAAVERVVTSVARSVGRRADEAALAAMADRVTIDWMKR